MGSACTGSAVPGDADAREHFVRVRGFPYPLERTTGSIDYNLQNQHLKFRLLAHASGDRPVRLKGDWKGDGPQAEVEVDINATDVPIDDKLLQGVEDGQSHHSV